MWQPDLARRASGWRPLCLGRRPLPRARRIAVAAGDTSEALGEGAVLEDMLPAMSERAMSAASALVLELGFKDVSDVVPELSQSLEARDREGAGTTTATAATCAGEPAEAGGPVNVEAEVQQLGGQADALSAALRAVSGTAAELSPPTAEPGADEGAAGVNVPSAEELLRQEEEAWGALFDATSLSHHMEEFYLDSLRSYVRTQAQQGPRPWWERWRAPLPWWR